jgi:hypothetical protein
MSDKFLQSAEKLGLFINHHRNLSYGTDSKIAAGCSKRLSSKAAASEEAKAYASVR